MSVLNVEVSCFRNYRTPENPVTVNLLTWLHSKKYQVKVLNIRNTYDKSTRDLIKSNLPGITPSGIFSYRSEERIIQHSGLIQFDIDLCEENKHIKNWNKLKKEISNIIHVAYCGLSVSGLGYWGLIPIAYPEKHKLYFDSIEKAFADFGIKIDPRPKNVASLRGYSWDDTAYFNHNAVVLTHYLEQGSPPKAFVKSVDIPGSEIVHRAIKIMKSACEGERHVARLKAGRLIGGYIAGGLLPNGSEQYLIDEYLLDYANIDSATIQKKEIKAIRDGVKMGMLSPITK